MFKKLFLFLCFICALFMQINYGNATGINEKVNSDATSEDDRPCIASGIDNINNNNVADFIKARKEAIDEVYKKGKNFFSYDNLNDCIGDVNANVVSYRKYISGGQEDYKTLSDENKSKLEELISSEETLSGYCRQNLFIITGTNDGSGFSSNGMLRGMCFFLSILRGNYAKTVAALFVIGLGFLMLFGNLKFTSYMFFVIALALAFGADQLANVISGNKFSCKYINISYKTMNNGIQCPTGAYYKNGRCAFNVCSNLKDTYSDKNLTSTITSVNNGTRVYRECSGGKHGYVEYICKDGELDYNIDTCYMPGNYCTAGALPRVSGAEFDLTGITVEIGTTIESDCIGDYKKGKAKIVCQRDGNWQVLNICKIDESEYCNTSNIYTDLGKTVNSVYIDLNVSKVKKDSPVEFGKTDSNISADCRAGYKGEVKLFCSEDSDSKSKNKKWAININCNAVRCSTKYNLDNGVYNITSENNFYGNEIIGVCNAGYAGTPKIKCGADGNWKVLSGSCTQNTTFCPTLSVANGTVDNRRTLGSYAVLRCNKGYKLSGDNTVLCTENGTWRGEFGTCELDTNYCREIDSNTIAGEIEYIDGNRALGSKAKVKCNNGYMLKGNGTLTCKDNKTWGLTSDICEVISCYNLPSTNNVGDWYGNMAIKGQEIQGGCKNGYTGKPKAICDKNGEWKITNNCAVDMYYCSSLSVADGKIQYSNERAIGSKATLTCNEGYELSGNSSVSCSEGKDGLWSDKIGSCQKVRCSTSVEEDKNLQLNNGKYVITNENNKFGDKVVGKCSLGYVGSPTATCNANKKWSTTGLCKFVECKELDKINKYSEYDGITSTKYGVPVKGTCKFGYKGSPIANCQADGTWSVKNDCQLNTEYCPKIKEVSGANISYKGSGRAIGSKAMLSCGTGFRLVGNDTATCRESGKWEAEIGTCQLITDFCTTLNAVENGSIKYTRGQAFNSTASLICDTGYGLRGNGKVVCLDSKNDNEKDKGLWNKELGVCEPEENWCPNITKSFSNGILSRTKSNNIGSVANLQCDIGYKVSGNARITCGSNKKWSGELGDCKLVENYCSNLSIKNGTITYLDTNKFAYNSNAKLECDVGYSLSGISSAKCQAGGKWSELGTCEITHCSTMEDLKAENGSYPKITAEKSTYNSVINGTCNKGYKGYIQAVCDENGKWVLSGLCNEKVVCGKLNSGDYSKGTIWSAEAATFGESIYGVCKVGYRTDCMNINETNCKDKDRRQPIANCGSDETSGVSEGKWEFENDCKKIMNFCPASNDANGKFSYSEEQALGSTETLNCNEGYEHLNGLEKAVCQEDKTWSNLIECKIKICKNPEQLEHVASWTKTETEYNTKIQGTCEIGYVGTPSAICLEDKTWGYENNCVLKTCPSPVDQAYMKSWDMSKANSDGKFNWNTTITGKCKTGYKGTPTAKCVDPAVDMDALQEAIRAECTNKGSDKEKCIEKKLSDGIWKYEGSCEIMTCSNPELPKEVKSWNSTITTYDASIYGTCIDGYEGKPEAKCNAQEQWDIVNDCKPKTCSNLKKQAESENQVGIASWKNDTATYREEIAGVCADGYTGTVTAVCKADQTWNIINGCKKNTTYCAEIPARNGTITYTDDQALGSVATLTCSGKYNTVIGAKEVKCISNKIGEGDSKGKWHEELGDCGAIVEFYSPRNDVAKQKVFKKGATFTCAKSTFDTDKDKSDPDPNVKKLCRIKGGKRYFGYDGSELKYTVNDTLFEKQSPVCHLAYADKDLSTDKLRKNYKAGGETKLYDGTEVYVAGGDSGFKENTKKYIINCSSGYVGKPEIVCDAGTWTWTPDEKGKGDNNCYAGGCDINDTSKLPTAGRHISGNRYTFESDKYSATQTIVKDGDIVKATCENGYVSNQDTENPKLLRGKCVNGIFERTIDDITYGDTCVPGCVYKDTSMGWTDEMMKGTTGNYTQYYDAKNTKNDWGTASIGEHAVRIDAKVNAGALLYKNCATGYKPAGTGTVAAVTDNKKHPLIKCSSNGKWSQHISYYMGCAKNMEYCPSLTVANGYASYSDSRAIGSTATLKCDSGYDLSYNPSRTKEPVTATCQSNGKWSNALEDCYKRCDVYFTGNIYICTNRSDYWCAYHYDPDGDCNLKNKWDNCHVENQMNARHGQTVNYSTSCYFRLYAGKNGGGLDSSCKDDRKNVGYWVTCTNGTYTVYPKE